MTEREKLFEGLSQINDDDFYQIWNSRKSRRLTLTPDVVISGLKSM